MLTSETRNPNRKPNAGDGPSRRRWTGFTAYEANPDTFMADNNAWRGSMPWLQPRGPGSGLRDQKPFYDFHKRRFRSRPHDGQWTNAWYPPQGGYPPNAVEMYPYMNDMTGVRRPDGDNVYFDPVNWGQNGANYGYWGDGGHYNPVIDGWP